MQLVSPRPGTVTAAFDLLVTAQAAAAKVSNGVTADAATTLAEGVRSAKLAAAELFSATPRSEYQDLIAARRQAITGQQLLERALVIARASAGAGTDAAADLQITRLAHDAFDTFDAALEILDND